MDGAALAQGRCGKSNMRFVNVLRAAGAWLPCAHVIQLGLAVLLKFVLYRQESGWLVRARHSQSLAVTGLCGMVTCPGSQQIDDGTIDSPYSPDGRGTVP